MTIPIIAVACFLASICGYASGFALHRWEVIASEDSPDQLNRFLAFAVMIASFLIMLFGEFWLLLSFEVVALLFTFVFFAVGFRVGHPQSAARLRAVARYLSGLADVLGLANRRPRSDEEDRVKSDDRR